MEETSGGKKFWRIITNKKGLSNAHLIILLSYQTSFSAVISPQEIEY